MAVTFHGFSIRDYTSQMRSVDVFKCWPFPAAGVSREQAESWLPPMTVSKSRRCSGELAGVRSDLAGAGGDEETENPPNEAVSDESESAKEDKLVRCAAAEEEEKVEMVCPVCRDFNAATLTAVNAHIDGCLARTVREERRRMRRSKSKAPKKRSIAEIFELKEDVEEKPRPEIEAVLKFSPFDAGEVSIAVAKFRWLSERLEALRSNGISFESAKSVGENSNSAAAQEESEMLCPVCRVFNAASVTAANAHIDDCLSTAMKDERRRKLSLKPKAPKKRSIADILTVAPQIDAAGDGEVAAEAEEEDEYERNGEESEKPGFGARIKSKKSTNNNVTRKKKMKKKVMRKKNKVEKRDVMSLNDESKKMNKRKKRKKNSLYNKFTAKKEDAYKRKMQNPVYGFRKLGTVGNKKVKLDDIDPSSAHEKKLGLKILSEEKTEKVKNWDSVGKQQKAESPIRGILKNHKHISGSASSDSNIQDGTEESHSDVQVPSSERHVRFSAGDYVLGPTKRNSFDETVFNLSSDELASSFGKDQSSGNVEGTVNLEENRNDNIAISTGKRKEVCPMVESKQFSNTLGQVAVQNFLKPCTNQEKSRHLVEKSESLSNVTICDNNLHRFDRGNTTTMHFSPHADVSRSLSAFQGWQTPGINTQACESEAFSYTGKFIDHLGDPTFQSTTVHSNANTRTYLEPSPSFSASCNEANERPEFPLHTYGANDNHGQALGGRSLSGLFSADMIDNSFLLPGWGKGSIRNNCIEQNFYGLPLNSHGELINLGSSGKVGMNQPETSCTLRGSLSGLPVNNVFHQNSQEYLSIGKRNVVQKTLQDRINPFPHYPGRLGVRELSGRERADIYQHNSDWCSNHHVQPLESELNLMRNPFVEQNQLDKVSNHKEYGMVSPRGSLGLVSPSSIQPTMRLMGKDVPIGRSNQEKQQSVGGVLWAEEESRRRHYSVDAAKDTSLLGRCSMPDWAPSSQSKIQTQNVLQSVKIQSNQALQSNLLMKGPNSEFLNLQSNHISQNGSLGTSTNLHPISKTSTSCTIYNKAAEDLPEQFISGAKPQGLCFHSQVPSTPFNFSQSTLSNGELNDWKKHIRGTNSAFGFPFLHPIVEEQAKSSWFKRSYRSLQPWSLGSTYERMSGSGSSSSTCFPQNTWRNNSTIPSVYHPVNALYPPNSVTTHCPRNALLRPASIAQPLHASVSPVTKTPSTIDGCRNIFKVTDRVKLDDMTAKEYPCINSRKRPADNLVDPAKPNKLPNIEVQKSLTHTNGLARETLSTNLQQNTRAVELDLQVGARSKCCQNEAQNLNPRSYLGFDSSNLDGVVISGPVKLSPGAKHILKPSQNQDNSTLVHSAIPIAATTDSGRDLELQGKLTKMYIF
ncbi:hypothetical protein E2542_SST28856 [Spatholobus suberectus]|nr:hypothetical protein E2542_SST28856 [Spatholobus suberectus]